MTSSLDRKLIISIVKSPWVHAKKLYKNIKNKYKEFKKKAQYQQWIKAYDTLTEKKRESIKNKIDQLPYKPLISVIMPVYNPPEKWLKYALDSVIKQLYSHWELCIADDASTQSYVKKILSEYEKKDSRIKVVYREKNGHISNASNSALALATGEFVALLDHDDELAEHALSQVVEELNVYPDCALIYSDEDKITVKGKRCDPYFKSDWNPDLFYGHNFISHLGVYRRSIINEIGGFRVGYEGSQDYDLALRVIEQISPNQIRHIPQILYHWRMIPGSVALSWHEKEYAYVKAREAIQSHFTRMGKSDIRVIASEKSVTHHCVIYPLPDSLPLVSIIIPTKDNLALLQRCVDSVITQTDYANFEVIIVDNQSIEEKTKNYFKQINHKKIKILTYSNSFNYSAINNYAVQHSAGEIIVCLNNDTEVITPSWLSEMVRHLLRPEIGVVGTKLYYPNDRIQHAGVIGGFGLVAGHIYRGLPKKSYGYVGKALLTQNFLAVTAACMGIRRAVFQELRGFDERLAVDFNDVDLCFRAYDRGYRILWTPFAELYHHESATRGLNRTAQEKVRVHQEAGYMWEKWSDLLRKDPFYNPNLSLAHRDCSLAFPPRA